MALAPTQFVRIDGTRVTVQCESMAEARVAIVELQVKKREYSTLKRGTLYRAKTASSPDLRRALEAEAAGHAAMHTTLARLLVQLQASILAHPG